MKQLITISLAVFLFLSTGCMSVDAASRFGIRVGTYNDMDDFFIGGELLNRVGNRIYFNPNFEYVLVDNFTYFTANADFTYNFLLRRSAAFMWIGGGAGLAYIDPEGQADANTELALNLLFGLGLDLRSTITPYIQGKFILGDLDEFVLAFGIRF